MLKDLTTVVTAKQTKFIVGSKAIEEMENQGQQKKR